MRSRLRPWLVLSGLAACGCSASEFDIPPWLRAPGRPVFLSEAESSYGDQPGVSYEPSSATWVPSVDPYGPTTSGPALSADSDPFGLSPAAPPDLPSDLPSFYPESSVSPFGGPTTESSVSPYSDTSVPSNDPALTSPPEITGPGLGSSASPFGTSSPAGFDSPPISDNPYPGIGVPGGPTENPYGVLRRNSGTPIDPSSFDPSGSNPPSGTDSPGLPGVPSTDDFNLPFGPTNDFDTSRPFETQQERFSRLLRKAMQGTGGTTPDGAADAADPFGGLNSAPGMSPFDRPGLFATPPDGTAAPPAIGTSGSGALTGTGTSDVPVHGGDRSILPNSLPILPPEVFAPSSTDESSAAPTEPQALPAAETPPAADPSPPSAGGSKPKRSSIPSVKDAGAKKG
jgi:hypothetical protein